MRVRGELDFSRRHDAIFLPDELQVDVLRLVGCVGLRRLPRQLTCRVLVLRESEIESLSADLNVSILDARNCPCLESVGPLRVDLLDLQRCINLVQLAEGIQAQHLNLNGCQKLLQIPKSLGPTLSRLSLRGCIALSQLPDGLMHLETLDVRGCSALTQLPDDIRIRSWIDVAGSGLTSLPWALRSTRVHWNGIHVPDYVAFEPESIIAAEVLNEANLEMRRILLERMGFARFVDEVRAVVVDEDCDAGGPRRLLLIPVYGSEHLVFVEVCCPSTGNRYVLRVPPNCRSCHQAVAWTAGFNDPSDYCPVVET